MASFELSVVKKQEQSSEWVILIFLIGGGRIQVELEFSLCS